MPSWERSPSSFFLPSFLPSPVVLRLQNIENLFCAITTATAAATESAVVVGEAISAGGKTDVARQASVFVPPFSLPTPLGSVTGCWWGWRCLGGEKSNRPRHVRRPDWGRSH